MSAGKANLGEQVGRFVVHIGTQLAEFLRTNWFAVIGGLVLLLIGMQAWEAFQDYKRHDVTFLKGPATGPSAEDARLIEEQLEQSGRVIDAAFNVIVEGTGGYEENRRRISEDEKGDLVGFAYDGFGDSENVATILPLDSRYLHVLCRKGFIDDLNKGVGSDERMSVENGISFGQLWKRLGEDPYKLLKPGRVHIGTDGSATQLCAKMVLEQFGLEAEKLRCNGINSDGDLRAALNRGEIDVAFSSSAFNSSTIREIAKDGDCVLVGLDGDRDAIRQNHPELLAVEFQPNSYLSGDFCPKKAQTIGARRVLVCSSNMSERDAYVVGMRTFEALRDRMPEIEWRNRPPGAEQIQTGPLRFRLHPGAVLIRDEDRPTSWPGGISVVLLTAVLWVVAEILRWVNSLFERPASEGGESAGPVEPPAGEPAEPASEPKLPVESEYDRLHREFEESLQNIRKNRIPMTKRTFNTWERRIRELEQRILKSNREGALTRDETHKLMAGVKDELRLEHEVSRPQPVKQGT